MTKRLIVFSIYAFWLSSTFILASCATDMTSRTVDRVRNGSYSGINAINNKRYISYYDSNTYNCYTITFTGFMYNRKDSIYDNPEFIGAGTVGSKDVYLSMKIGDLHNNRVGYISDDAIEHKFTVEHYERPDVYHSKKMQLSLCLLPSTTEFRVSDINKGGSVMIPINNSGGNDNNDIRIFYVYNGVMHIGRFNAKFSPNFYGQVKIIFTHSLYLVSIPLDLSVLPIQPVLCWMMAMGRLGGSRY